MVSEGSRTCKQDGVPHLQHDVQNPNCSFCGLPTPRSLRLLRHNRRVQVLAACALVKTACAACRGQRCVQLVGSPCSFLSKLCLIDLTRQMCAVQLRHMPTRFCVAFWNTLFVIELFSADTSRLNMAKTGDMSSYFTVFPGSLAARWVGCGSEVLESELPSWISIA